MTSGDEWRGELGEGVFAANSRAFSIPDFLSFLEAGEKSGELELSLPTERIGLLIQDGRVVDAWSDHSPVHSRVGAILVHQKALDAHLLEEFLARGAPDDLRLGRALRAVGLISAQNLNGALEEQRRRILGRVRRASGMPYRFRESG